MSVSVRGWREVTRLSAEGVQCAIDGSGEECELPRQDVGSGSGAVGVGFGRGSRE